VSKQTLKEVNFKLGASGGSKAASEFKKVEKAGFDVEAAFARAAQSMGALLAAAAGVGAALAVGFGAQGVLVKRSAAFGEQIERMAVGFSTSAQEIQRLNTVFKVLGGSTDDLADAMGTITDRAKSALEGSADSLKEFKRVGISLDELKDKKPAELLRLFMERASVMKDRTQALTASVRTFGDDLGRRLIPALTTGEASFRDLERVAGDLGLILSPKETKNLKLAQVEFRKLQFTVEGLGNSLGAALAPAFGYAAKGIQTFIQNNFVKGKSPLSAKWMKSWAQLMGDEFKKIGTFAQSAFEKLGGSQAADKAMTLLQGVVPLVTEMVVGFMSLAASAGVVYFFKMLGGVGLILGVVLGGIIAILFDLFAYMEGGDSIIGRLIDRSPRLKTAMMDVTKAVDGLAVQMERLGVASKSFLTYLTQGKDDEGLSQIESSMVTFIVLVVKAVEVTADLAANIAAVVSLMIELAEQLKRAYDYSHGIREVWGGTWDVGMGVLGLGATATDIIGGTTRGLARGEDLRTAFGSGATPAYDRSVGRIGKGLGRFAGGHMENFGAVRDENQLMDGRSHDGGSRMRSQYTARSGPSTGGSSADYNARMAAYNARISGGSASGGGAAAGGTTNVGSVTIEVQGGMSYSPEMAATMANDFTSALRDANASVQPSEP